MKNGMATGTAVGRANGLESFTRTCDSYNMTHTSVDIAILPYGSPPRPNSTDISYGTPYWWLEEQIKSNFPGSFLYPVVN